MGQKGCDCIKVGYVRVSTENQNTARQEVLMKELGVEKLFIDKASGKNTDRPELKKMMSFVRKGDVVIVESISRFARNTRDLLRLVDMLKEKEVDFISKKEYIDSSTPTGRFVLVLFGALSELERENTLERQKEGIIIAKKEGKYKGRKKIVRDNFELYYQKWVNDEITATDAMKCLCMSKSTFYRRIKQKEEEINGKNN